MTEIEVKILEIDREKVLARLRELGATLYFDGEMVAQFFDDSVGSLLERKDLLRLRSEGDVNILTFKKPISAHGAKIMQEFETPVGDVYALRNILMLLGFAPYRTTEKRRIEYMLGDTKVLIDTYTGDLAYIPEFVEIEAPSEERLYEVVALLGFAKSDCLPWNTHNLIEHYQKK